MKRGVTTCSFDSQYQDGETVPVSLFQLVHVIGMGDGTFKGTTDLSFAGSTRVGFTVGTQTDGGKVYVMVA